MKHYQFLKWWVQSSQLVSLCYFQHKSTVYLCIYGRPGSDKWLGSTGAAHLSRQLHHWDPGAEFLLSLLTQPRSPLSLHPTACSASAPLNYISQESCNRIKCLWSLRRNPCQVTLISILGFDPSGFNQFSFSSSSLNPQRLPCKGEILCLITPFQGLGFKIKIPDIQVHDKGRKIHP